MVAFEGSGNLKRPGWAFEKRGQNGNVFTGSTLWPWEMLIWDWLVRIDYMRNKNEKEEITQNHLDNTMDVAAVAKPKEIVKKYLESIDMRRLVGPNTNLDIYYQSRDILYEGLQKNANDDPVIAALIERVARTALILDKYDRKIIIGSEMTKDEMADYHKIQEQHRKCLEAFKNITFIEHRVVKESVLERLKKTVNSDGKNEEVKTITMEQIKSIDQDRIRDVQ